MTDLKNITLAKGSHNDCDDGMCLFEAYNWLSRQQHTDACPPGVSPVLHTFGMRLNDALPDDRRQDLKQYLPNGVSLLAGTADDGLDETRSYMALDWLIRTYTPAFLDLAGLSAEATTLRDLRRVADMAAAEAAGPVVRDASSKAYAARDAARAAAWDAARDAARAAAWDAAGDAAWAAAGDAAGDVLKPTVTALQDSAIALYGQMIRPGAA
jgi:hypothetical protein